MNGPGEWRDLHILTDDLQEAFSPTIPSALLPVRIHRSCALTAPLKCLEALKIHYKVPLRLVCSNSRYRGLFQRFYEYKYMAFTIKFCRFYCKLNEPSICLIMSQVSPNIVNEGV